MLDTETERRAMIVTEKEAAKMFCKIGGPDHADESNYASSGKITYYWFGSCAASQCMHWEYLFRQDEVSALADEERTKYPPYGRGFCGAVKSKLMVI